MQRLNENPQRRLVICRMLTSLGRGQSSQGRGKGSSLASPACMQQAATYYPTRPNMNTLQFYIPYIHLYLFIWLQVESRLEIKGTKKGDHRQKPEEMFCSVRRLLSSDLMYLNVIIIRQSSYTPKART